MDRQLPYRSRAPGTKRERGGLLVAAAGLALAIAATPAASQESGTVTGVVTDETTGQLLEGTRVSYEGGTQRALATQAGRYVLANVPAGTHTLTFELIGYESATAEVRVVAGATTQQDVALVSGAIRIQDLVVTGVARATPKAKLPIVVERLDAELLPVPAISAESFLAAKFPGVKVVRGSGQPGSTGDILLRGATSIAGGQSALIVVDGVISGTSLDDLSGLDIASIETVKGAAGASLYGSRAANGVIVIRTKRGGRTDSQDYSRIVVRNEVGGDQMPGRIQLSQYHPYKVDPVTGKLVDVNEDIIDDITDPDRKTDNPDLEHPEGVYKSFQDNEWPADMDRYDHIDRIYTTGVYMSNYVATEGRNGPTNYRASIEHNDQSGVLSRWNDGFQRRGFRLNLDHGLREDLKVSVSSAYNHLDQEDIGGNPFFLLTFMGPYVDLLRRDSSTFTSKGGVYPCPDQGCLYVNPDPLSNVANPLYEFELIDLRDKQKNMRASANVVWNPFSWMDLQGNFGFDANSFRETNFTPQGMEGFGTAPPSDGALRKTQSHTTRSNADATLSMSRAIGDVAARIRMRYLQEIERYEGLLVEGNNFVVQGVPQLDNLDPATIEGRSSFREQLAEGFYLITAADYLGKYIFDGVLRRDGSSLFGENHRWQTYWRTAGAWRPTQESWWPVAAVNELKLRAALGTAGRRPGFSAQYETYDITGGVIVPTTLGNANLRPQRSTELEAGLDLLAFNTLTAGLTYARTVSTDQIMRVPLGSYTGYGYQWQNAGTMSSNTWELFLEAPIIRSRDVGWDFRVNLDRTRQRIDSLYRPPFASEDNFFFYQAGEVFGAFYGARWATECADLPRFDDDPARQREICDQNFKVNDDGLLVYTGMAEYTQGIQGTNFLWGSTSDPFVIRYDLPNGEFGEETIIYQWGMPIATFGQDPVEFDTTKICEYRVQSERGCGSFLYMGNTTPSFNVSAMNTFRWKGFELYALLDGEFGATIYNQTRQWAYRESRSADQDQFGKDEGYKKPVAYYSALYAENRINSWFVEAGDFVKLREVSLKYSASPHILETVFGSRLSGVDLTIIGRNLLTLTEYSGYDPEVGMSGEGGSAVVGRIDNYQYPNYRNVSASVRLVF